MSDLLAAAHDYRSRGWRVIQLHSVGGTMKMCSCRAGGKCQSAGKHPIEREWQDTPTLSAADIEALWEARPKANVGIATGAPSGFWVLDIDPKGGGMDSMRALVEAHGPLPETFTVQTGSGGFHYYFQLTDFPIKSGSNHIAPGIDTRAEGGQVVAPPSVSDVGPYMISRDAPIAPTPAWLLDYLPRKDERADLPVITAEELPKPEDLSEAEWERLSRYAHKAVSANLERLTAMSAAATPDPAHYRGEPWNHTTFEVACSLVEIANSPWNPYSLGEAHSDLMAYAPRDAEFDDYIVNRCWESARSRVGDKARPMPEDRRAEPDPLFMGPDVQQRTNPTQGGGTEGKPVVASPGRFFDEKGGLLVDVLGQGVRELGPIGWGRDEAWWSYQEGVWKQDPKVVRQRASWLLGGKLRKGHAVEATEHLQFRPDIPIITGEPHPQWMNFTNTMLDWQTGETKPHNPSYLSTIQFPVAWNPEAECPTVDAFLADVLHEDYVKLAWEMLGYLLFSGNKLQVAFLLYGGGGNGKGALIRLVERMLGTDNIANEPLDRLNGDRFSTINLFGKIANIAGDIDATYQESTANFKRLTGEDKVAAERKYGDRFTFESWAVPLFSANKIPGSADVTEGYLRRWVVLHFHKRVVPNANLEPAMWLELEGVVAKAVVALRDLMKRNKFDPQGRALEAKNEFAEAIDQVRQWVASDEVVTAPEHLASLSELYAGYTAWANRTNRGRLSDQEFSHRLEAVGYEHSNGGGTTFFKGLRVRDPHQQQARTPAQMFDD